MKDYLCNIPKLWKTRRPLFIAIVQVITMIPPIIYTIIEKNIIMLVVILVGTCITAIYWLILDRIR